MSSSPYTPKDTKKYMRTHNLQQLINSTVNTLLKSKPDDPYGFMIGILQNKASSDIQILNIKGIESLSADNLPVIKIYAHVLYMNQEVKILLDKPFGILSDDNMIYDGDQTKYGGKGVKKGLTYFNDNLVQKIRKYKCMQQNDIDKQILTSYKQNNQQGLYQINTLSYSIPRIQAQVIAKPLYQIIRNLATDNTQKQQKINHIPFMVNCLQGGKAIGSKCKVTKYILINNKCTEPMLAVNILQAIRKSIVSGKGGQAALKLSPDGTFVCPLDTIMDNLKIVEDAINNTPGAKQGFSIGLSWAADTLYTVDTKKYELQNPKTPFDNDQMIDYLVKLVTDKPIIKYLEDPLATTEISSWKKLKTKLSQGEVTKDVKIGSKIGNIFKLPEQNIAQQLKPQIQQLSQPLTTDSHPDLSPEQLQQKNNKKLCLDYFSCRLFELRTLSQVINLASLLSKFKTKLILQDNLYETIDTTIVDVSLAVNGVMCLGSINGNKMEKITKFNRIKEIIQLQDLYSCEQVVEE